MTSSPTCQWTKIKDLSLASFLCPLNCEQSLFVSFIDLVSEREARASGNWGDKAEVRRLNRAFDSEHDFEPGPNKDKDLLENCILSAQNKGKFKVYLNSNIFSL